MIAVAHTIIACVMVLNGTIGARLHVGFPVLNRSSFGFWFSYFSVVSRVVLALFWFGVLTYTGSECIYQVGVFYCVTYTPVTLIWIFILYQMLKAIWPSIQRMPNHLPSSAKITTSGETKRYHLPMAVADSSLS